MFDSRDMNNSPKSEAPSGTVGISGTEMGLGLIVASAIWAARVVAAEDGVIFNVIHPAGSLSDDLIMNSFSNITTVNQQSVIRS